MTETSSVVTPPLIWEGTQAAVAVLITLAVIYTAIYGIESIPLTNAFFLVAGFYFGRTNNHLAANGQSNAVR